MTRTEIRRGLGDEIEKIIGGYNLLCVNDVNTVHEVQLPLITYWVGLSINYGRGYDEKVEKNMDTMTGTVTQLVPHDVQLDIRVHSDSMTEVDDLYHLILQKFGMAPCLYGIGFKLVAVDEKPTEKLGVYSQSFRYVGWVMLEGAGGDTEFPLVQNIRFNVLPSQPTYWPPRIPESFEIGEAPGSEGESDESVE